MHCIPVGKPTQEHPLAWHVHHRAQKQVQRALQGVVVGCCTAIRELNACGDGKGARQGLVVHAQLGWVDDVLMAWLDDGVAWVYCVWCMIVCYMH